MDKRQIKINVLPQTHNAFSEMQFLLKLKLFKVYKAGGASCMPLKKWRGWWMNIPRSAMIDGYH